MTGTKQIAANRRNARKSTGPTTSAGKGVSRLNAVTHGLTAQTPILPGEDETAFMELRERVLKDLQPSSTVETELGEHVASILWRLRRLGLVEKGIFAWEWFGEVAERADAEAASYDRNDLTEALEMMNVTVVNEDAKARAQEQARAAVVRRNAEAYLLGCSFRRDAATADAFGKLCRYQTSLERSLFRALRELDELRDRD